MGMGKNCGCIVDVFRFGTDGLASASADFGLVAWCRRRLVYRAIFRKAKASARKFRTNVAFQKRSLPSFIC